MPSMLSLSFITAINYCNDDLLLKSEEMQKGGGGEGGRGERAGAPLHLIVYKLTGILLLCRKLYLLILITLLPDDPCSQMYN